MDEQKEHLKALSDIRSMMERSSRCISLSGLSGVFAGIFALIGAYLAYIKLSRAESNYLAMTNEDANNLMISLFVIAGSVLAASLIVGTLLTVRNSKRRGLRIWDNAAQRLLINLMIPLATGGLFCLILVYHGELGMVAPGTLIFYGLALINASKYTFNDIRYLGLCEIVLGLGSALYMGYGLFFWAFGFGILHIVYGAVMYFKYERK